MSASYYASIADIANRLRTLRDEAAKMSATADSPDGLVRATVNARGELLELELDERIYRTADSVALAATINATIQSAATLLEADLAVRSGELFPEESA